MLIADDASLAAQVSCVLARPRTYLPVIDGPRILRPDAEAEVVRRNNAVARTKANRVIFVGLCKDSRAAMLKILPSKIVRQIDVESDISILMSGGASESVEPILWGRNRLGIGLLKALRLGRSIRFHDGDSPIENVPSKSEHLVICEEGEDLSEVIAANYAYAIGAGLYLLPRVDPEKTKEILELFYGLYDQTASSPSDVLRALNSDLRQLCGDFPIPHNGSLTFVTGGLPYGVAFPEVPATHLFKYPDLGIAVINGFAAEQHDSHGTNVAVVVDPGTVDAPEISAAKKLLPKKKIFLRGYQGPGANVLSISRMVELFPYDLLIIATHCGDVSGYRWTYEFKDSEGIDRCLVVEIAVGFANTKQDDLYEVTQFTRFISLDGVRWNDPRKEEKIYVGTAMKDYIFRTGNDGDLEPVKKEDVKRVIGSSVLKMFDHNYIPIPRSLACEGTPIIVNNACVSWHELAGRFTFGNARAYVGTLFSVSTSEAEEIVLKLLGKHFGKPLPVALWAAQREIYGDSVRRPYVVSGVFPQKIRATRRDLLRDILSSLNAGRVFWTNRLATIAPREEKKIKWIKEYVTFYEDELVEFKKRWFDN